MLGTLEAHEIETVLRSQVVGRIACYADGETYIVPVSYAYDGTSLYMHAKEGKKMSMMRKNPHVCFETDVMESMANWRSVVAWGVFEELRDEASRSEALQILLNRMLPLVSSETTHLSPHWPFPPKHTNEIQGSVYRIKLERKTGRFECNHEDVRSAV